MSGSSDTPSSKASQSRDQQLELAARNCQAMLDDNPEDPHCLHVLALIEAQLGRHLSALTWIEKSLKIQPKAPDVLCNYGVMLADQSRYDDALMAFRQAIECNPDNIEAHYHYGNVLYKQGNLNDAMKAYRHVIGVQPNHIYALNNLGNVYKTFENFEDALECYRRILEIQPDFPMALNNMGLTLTAVGNFDEALVYLQRALSLQPAYAEAMNNIGVALRLKGEFRKSCGWYRQALALRVDYVEAWNNLGNALKDLGELEEAIKAYEQAISLGDGPDKRHNLAMAFLTAGDFERGWQMYEHRWHAKQHAFSYRSFSQPLWQGEEGAGRILLIHAEQGYGDSIQFCRYASLAADRGFRVILEVQPPLVKLMRSLRAVERVISRGDVLPDFDVHCPMLSLPLAFGTRTDTIPAIIPYLQTESDLVEKWQSRFADVQSCLKIGIVWSGNPRLHSLDSAAVDRRRSIPFEALIPFLGIPNAKFYSLQKTAGKISFSSDLIDYMGDCRDFADTAALIANLDLVISVDTAVAHLAGAMGKPIWLLNRFDACWRWLRGREDSAWYPTLRQFRQPEPGDWVSVIAAVRAALLDPNEMNKLIKGVA